MAPQAPLGTGRMWVPPGPSILELAAGTVAGVGAAMAPKVVHDRAVRAVVSVVRDRPIPEPQERAAAAIVESGEGEQRGIGDPGWFGPDSVAWRVHADTSILVAGVTAFALQSLHPLALAGVVDHSAFAEDFVGRTRRTGEWQATVVYGTSAQAAAEVATVRRVHERVVGVAPDGRPYAANDPELLAWVHVAEYLAIAATHRRFALRPLRRPDLDRYVAEVAVVGRALGVPEPPRSWAELDAAFQRFRPQLAAGEQALAAADFLRDPPGLPPAARPVWRLLWAGGIASLPPTARRLLGLARPPLAEVVACRAAVRALGALLGPPPLLRQAQRRLTSVSSVQRGAAGRQAEVHQGATGL